MSSYRIRSLDFRDSGEVYTAASFSMMTLLETLPEARADPELVPNFSVEEMAAMYRSGQSDPDHRYLVIVDDNNRPVGHAIALIRCDDDGTRYGYSYTRYILPHHRRRGLARRLLRAAKSWWAEAGVSHVLAHTHPENKPLQTLFIDEGFQVVERRDGRWPSLLLRCELQP
ncbi:MAG: GNAT superfamily N-acetyltransferase [Myxococcota bacterium]